MLMIVLAFVLFVLFFNDHSVMQSMEYSRQIDSLEQEKRRCEDTIAKYLELNERLVTDPATIERIVREHYHFQRANEDVYVFDDSVSM